MAIDTKYTMGSYEYERPRASTASFTEEGMLAVRSMNAITGEEEATHCTVAGSLIPLGFTKLDTISPAAVEVIQEDGLEVPASADSDGDYHVTLNYDAVTSALNANGDVAVYNVTGSAWLTLGAAIADGTFTLSDGANGILEFHSAQAGIVINVVYRRTLSAHDRDMKYQQRHVNAGAQDLLDVVGIIAGEGQIYTDQYDVHVGNWTTGTLTTGPLGTLTMGGGGTDVSSWMRVIKTPSADNPKLGIAFRL